MKSYQLNYIQHRKNFMAHSNNYQFVQIGLASPEQIFSWAERVLPNGEIVGRVTKPHTIHYKTHKPERDGLFCERIFGPVKSGTCSCGKYQGISTKDIDHPDFCEQCGVELTDSRVRRHRMGYIKLAALVTHVWYLKSRPSYIAHLLEMPLKDIESLVYCDCFMIGPGLGSKFRLLGAFSQGATEFANKKALTRKRFLRRKYIQAPKIFKSRISNDCILFQKIKTARKNMLKRSLESFMEPKLTCGSFVAFWLRSLELYLGKWFNIYQSREISTGADAIYKMLINMNLEIRISQLFKKWEKLAQQTEKIWDSNLSDSIKIEPNIDIQSEKGVIIRCLKIIKHLIKAKIQPQWMILSVLPVLPPDLRPIVELKGGQLISSDLNELYRKVLFRNEELLTWLSFYQWSIPPAGLVARLQRESLQRAVDALLANGMGARPLRDINKRAYKSFSALITGKKGRFRENLLGKRVDYSGRSVIVVGPSLALHQCGIPREIAIELFQPFIVRELIDKLLVPNLRAAKNMIQNKQPIVWKVLQEVIKNRVVVLNRAPTLHRLGIQAFQPILVKERAIHLHPLVCAGFNADFDGDQMAIHVPLSWEAQVEARVLMWSQANLLSPATGNAVAVPSQDMLLGNYVLTLEPNYGIHGMRYFKNRMTNALFKKKIPVFYHYDHVLMALHQAHLMPSSILWLRCQTSDITVVFPREGPIEMQYESCGTSLSVYEHSQIRSNTKGYCIHRYILTTAGRVAFNQQIRQAIEEHIKQAKL
uniref:DNA-directed RNA polymerase subunit beta' n=1 Tax=Netrium digitus TaxID=43946 RepID=A0A191T552_9VIRI|nr:beta' subunit of RNA polymerase [Netrium digitus]ANI25528.1 beta' subunit of RNA polymerase [Netrium digitus]